MPRLFVLLILLMLALALFACEEAPAPDKVQIEAPAPSGEVSERVCAPGLPFARRYRALRDLEDSRDPQAAEAAKQLARQAPELDPEQASTLRASALGLLLRAKDKGSKRARDALIELRKKPELRSLIEALEQSKR